MWLRIAADCYRSNPNQDFKIFIKQLNSRRKTCLLGDLFKLLESKMTSTIFVNRTFIATYIAASSFFRKNCRQKFFYWVRSVCIFLLFWSLKIGRKLAFRSFLFFFVFLREIRHQKNYRVGSIDNHIKSLLAVSQTIFKAKQNLKICPGVEKSRFENFEV